MYASFDFGVRPAAVTACLLSNRFERWTAVVHVQVAFDLEVDVQLVMHPQNP